MPQSIYPDQARSSPDSPREAAHTATAPTESATASLQTGDKKLKCPLDVSSIACEGRGGNEQERLHHGANQRPAPAADLRQWRSCFPRARQCRTKEEFSAADARRCTPIQCIVGVHRRSNLLAVQPRVQASGFNFHPEFPAPPGARRWVSGTGEFDRASSIFSTEEDLRAAKGRGAARPWMRRSALGRACRVEIH